MFDQSNKSELKAMIHTAGVKRIDVGTALRKDYQCPTDYSRPQRAAHCIAWCAANYPYQLVPWTLICMSINAYKKAPMATSKEVVSLRGSATSIRGVLIASYQLELVIGPEMQVRASVDDTDIAKNVLPKRARRVRQSHLSFTKTVELINPDKIKDPEFRKWFGKDVRDIMKLTGDPSFLQKLLPPAPKKSE